MTNPLLNTKGLPVFSRIQPQHVEPAVDRLLNENRAEVRRLLSSNSEYTWENLLQPLEELEDKLNRAWSPVAHMNAVVNTPALRASYSACLPKLSEYATEMGQDEELFQAFRQIAEGPEYRNLDTAQRKIVDNDMRDFRLSGIELGPEAKQRYKIIMQELSSLQARFEDNLLDATNEWSKPVTDESVLAGLPKSAVDLAKQNAQNNELNGWLFNLESPSFQPVMNYADNRQLRREMYEAYVTRASDQGPHDKRLDNTPVMASILALRHEAAQLLGFDNYAERSLATKMAQSTDQVLSFLNDLAERSISLARKDLDEVRAFARDLHGPEELEAWDIPYYSEQLRQHKFSFSQEQLKPYFPEPKVLPGMFAVVQRLYGLQITEKQGVDTWHPEVRFFEIYDDQGKLRGQFYLDLYARPKKRGGAWMDECLGRAHRLDAIRNPVAYLVCNQTPPVGDKPSLMTFSEVETLFHEFGHGLQHMLTTVDEALVAGIRNVEWDAVELPSQFMENWCYDRETLLGLAVHYETGETLPDALFDKITSARTYRSGSDTLRQVFFSLTDLELHSRFVPGAKENAFDVQRRVAERATVMAPLPEDRFLCKFGHIFGGGYAAGYYSYKWAEVLSADAFAAFEEAGLGNNEAVRSMGRRFRDTVLGLGGSQTAMETFVAFRGREPSTEALLRHSGLHEEG